MYISLFFKETDLLRDNGLNLDILYSQEFEIIKYCQYNLSEIITSTESGIKTLSKINKDSYNYIDFLKILKNFKTDHWDIKKTICKNKVTGFFVIKNIEVEFNTEITNNVYSLSQELFHDLTRHDIVQKMNSLLKPERFYFKDSKDFFDYV
jgi:hypothetical protein